MSLEVLVGAPRRGAPGQADHCDMGTRDYRSSASRVRLHCEAATVCWSADDVVVVEGRPQNFLTVSSEGSMVPPAST